MQEVILVNEKDEEVGTAEKMEAHQKGLLHRAFSIFVFNSKGELLLQQRAMNKYHSAGLWTNTCCSHPGPGENTEAAARRRLIEEMGFDTPVQKVGDFIYKARFVNGLTEHEFDHVLAGEYDGPVVYNTAEVMDICFKSMHDIRHSLKTHPQKYTVWFHLALPELEEWWNRRFGNRKT
jgi:isopentenyl-diphosphate Delta-isomerase